MPTPKKYGFGKDDKLKSRQEIAQLFEAKISVFSYPMKCIYRIDRNADINGFHVKMASICPKRIFKKAVSRNKIKRRIREAYRLNKEILFSDNQYIEIHLAIIYVGKRIHDFKEIEKSMIEILQKISSTYLK